MDDVAGGLSVGVTSEAERLWCVGVAGMEWAKEVDEESDEEDGEEESGTAMKDSDSEEDGETML